MSFPRGGGGYPSREGLFSRPSQGEQAQVSIEVGPAFDLDQEVEGLRGQVGQLKTLARAIGQEAQENQRVAESLEEVMESTKLALRRGMKRLNRAFARSKSNHLLYLGLFVTGCLFVVIFWAKTAAFLHMFF